jgi:hypothetical protein
VAGGRIDNQDSGSWNDLGDSDLAAGGQVDDVIAANAPKILAQMPQIPQTANAPNAPIVTLENTEFAQPTGWGNLWRMERNGLYFKFKLRFTDAKDTPKELQKVTRQGGKITPKIERGLRRRPGKGRHEESRLEASRFRSRALDLASRIRSSSGRGAQDQDSVFSDERRSLQRSGEYRGHNKEKNHDGDSGRSHMPQLPSLDNADELPSVQSTDWVM